MCNCRYCDVADSSATCCPLCEVFFFICATFGELSLFRSSKDCLPCRYYPLNTCKHVERCVILQIGLHTRDVSGVSSNAVFEWLAIIALYFFTWMTNAVVETEILKIMTLFSSLLKWLVTVPFPKLFSDLKSIYVIPRILKICQFV